MDRLVAMARRHQPGLIVVDRTVGGRYENYRTPEQEVPEKPLSYVWETCMTMGDQWSYKPNDQYKSTHRLIHLLVDVVGKGGNFLLNVGPQPNGELPAPALERMNEIGRWLKINGEAIYGTRPIAPYKDGQVVFTQKRGVMYGIYLTNREGEALPETISLGPIRPAPGSKVRMLGYRKPLEWDISPGGKTLVAIPEQIRKSPPGRHAFALRLQSDAR
jgi:alpha-L-fucosidase